MMFIKRTYLSHSLSLPVMIKIRELNVSPASASRINLNTDSIKLGLAKLKYAHVDQKIEVTT